MKSVISIGEALIDFIPNEKGCQLKEVLSFERMVGGAPTNVCSVAAKLGGNGKIITQLGKDPFGDYIVDMLNQVGVDTNYVLRTEKANTALAFVSLMKDGNREFSFYRKPSADMLMEPTQLNELWFEECGVLHFCSVDLIPCPMKETHKKAIEYALKKKSIISFDPNVRFMLWESKELCRETIREFIPMAHILKISDEELEFITGYNTIEEAKNYLFSGNAEIILYSKGKEGAQILTRKWNIQVKSPKVQAIDTTGAGDSVIGAFLYCLIQNDIGIKQLELLDEATLKKYLTFSNYYATNSVLKKGAISSYADLEEITYFIEKYRDNGDSF